MDIVLYILALLCAVLGVVGAIVPVIPGTILSFAALVCVYLSSTFLLSLGWLFVWLGICVAAMLIDLYLPIYMTRKFGGSKAGTWGATIGMIVGFIAFPPFGVILGPLFGAIMGELTHDKNDTSRALKVGMGSFLAFLVGTGLKFAISMFILWMLIQSIWGQVEIWIEQTF